MRVSIYGRVSKWGVARALPVAEEARARSGSGRNLSSESENSKFRAPQQDITGLTPQERNIAGNPHYEGFYIRTGIEVVITGLTRNQFVGNTGTWVRIPPRPPFGQSKRKLLALTDSNILFGGIAQLVRVLA